MDQAGAWLEDMEKVQIVRYALMQIVAVMYGVWSCAAAVKINRPFADDGFTMPDMYYRAVFFRDYGAWFLLLAVIWTVLVAYLSSPYAKWEVDEGTLTWSGILVAVFLVFVGTSLALGGASPPPHLLTPL
jgi:hypothetical protein